MFYVKNAQMKFHSRPLILLLQQQNENFLVFIKKIHAHTMS